MSSLCGHRAELLALAVVSIKTFRAHVAMS